MAIVSYRTPSATRSMVMCVLVTLVGVIVMRMVRWQHAAVSVQVAGWAKHPSAMVMQYIGTGHVSTALAWGARPKGVAVRHLAFEFLYDEDLLGRSGQNTLDACRLQLGEQTAITVCRGAVLD